MTFTINLVTLLELKRNLLIILIKINFFQDYFNTHHSICLGLFFEYFDFGVQPPIEISLRIGDSVNSSN